jgi:cytochrome b561
MIERLRRWARRHTRRRLYSPVGVAFHWTVASLIVFQLWWGWRTSRLPVGPDKLEAYEMHSQVGLAILVITLLRLVWRLMIPGPVNDADKPGWQSKAAHLTHVAFYICLIGMPLSGWAMLSATARDYDLSVAGVAPWPQLPLGGLAPPQRWAIEAWSEQIHWGFVIALLVLIPLHVGATLKHELIDRDDVLRGMLPGIRTAERFVRQAPQRIAKLLRPHRGSDAGSPSA